MINFISLVFTFTISFFFIASCEQQTSPNYSMQETTYMLALSQVAKKTGCSKVSSDADFWVRDLSTSSESSYCVSSTLVGSGKNINLYLENGLYTDLNYSQIISEFDNNIKPKSDKAFGVPSDINNDGKITILILDIKDGATSGSGFVAGFVDPINFYSDDPGYSVRSNQQELLYMDGKELVLLRKKEMAQGLPDTFLSTIAHEYQHMIRFQYGNGNDETWVDEGTSEVASDISGYGPQTARMECFRGDTSKSSCTGGMSGWSLVSWSSKLQNYAFAYSFMKYLYTISGTTDDERNEFFKMAETGVPNTSIRADSGENLIRVFGYSKNYDKSILTNNISTIFKYTFALFIGQSVGYSNFSSVYVASSSSIPMYNLSNAVNKYPLPSALKDLYIPTPFNSVNALSSYNLLPTQTYRVNGTFKAAISSDHVVVASSSEYIVFNGKLSSSQNTSSTLSLEEPIQYPKLQLADQDGRVCPLEHLNTLHKITKSQRQMKSMLGR